MKAKTLYMNPKTGSVDTYENWEADFEEGFSEHDACYGLTIDEAISEGFLIEIEEDT